MVNILVTKEAAKTTHDHPPSMVGEKRTTSAVCRTSIIQYQGDVTWLSAKQWDRIVHTHVHASKGYHKKSEGLK